MSGRIGILGGAFDPPHLGHIALSKFVLDNSDIKQVWLMPCFGHMYGKEMASAEHRIAMCKLAAQEDLRIKVSDFEIKHQLRGETFQTAKLLLGSYEGKHCYEFAWIIGMDNANSAPQKWVNFAELERMMPFVVVPRIGETRDQKVRWYLQPPHLFLEPDDEKTISGESSTQVRKWIELHKICTDGTAEWLPSGVQDYINQHKLYVPK